MKSPGQGGRITRRDFLKLVQAGSFALAVPMINLSDGLKAGGRVKAWEWPSTPAFDFPEKIRSILERVPYAYINEKGYLVVKDPNKKSWPAEPVLLAPTLWNQLKRYPNDRLDPRVPWGIVLHWYGDSQNFDRSLAGYLRGFDSLREVDGEITRTSSHFLVGDGEPVIGFEGPGDPLGIIQTQAPDQDGTPFVSSHLRPLNYRAYKNQEQYFVRALFTLTYQDPRVHGLLQDLFEGPRIDPNMRTISIEIAGQEFGDPETYPSDQKIANTLAVVCAIMKRYNIPASAIMGHMEIQLGKPDPGKKFMALMRTLVGVKALVEPDQRLKQLVFGSFKKAGGEPNEAVQAYFRFVRDFIVLTGYPQQIYEWETESNYWTVYDRVAVSKWTAGLADQALQPITGNYAYTGSQFLHPENHEGIDLGCERSDPYYPVEVQMIAGGECLFVGANAGYHPGNMAVFRHIQPNGASVLSVYGKLGSIGEIEAGKIYPKGFPIGSLANSKEQAYLHFAMAYGATWETDLRVNQAPPADAGPGWIRRRYLSPEQYLYHHNSSPNQEQIYNGRL